jgi:hypothetical protein
MCMVKAVTHPWDMPRHRSGILFALLVTLAAPPAYGQEEVPADRIVGVWAPGGRVFGPGDSLPYPVLLRRVEQEGGWARVEAMQLMRVFFPDSARAVALRLFPTFGGTEAAIATYAILGDSGEGLPQLLALLASLPPDVLEGIGYPLGEGIARAGADGDSLRRALMGSSRLALRVLAMDLFSIRIDPTPVGPAQRAILAEGARDQEPKVRVAALKAIAWRVPPSDTGGMLWAAGYFDSALDDREPEVRREGMDDIAWRGIHLPGRVEFLRALAREARLPWERPAAIRALGVQRDAARPAIPDLLKYLEESDPVLRNDALYAIEELARAGVPMGIETRVAVRAYRARRVNPYSQLNVMRTLGALRDSAALAALTMDPDTIVAAGAVRILAAFAPGHPAVATALDDGRPDVVAEAWHALVPLLFHGRAKARPRTPGGRAALDSARASVTLLRNSRLVGRCFVVQQGRFVPALGFGADSQAAVTPREIVFLAEPISFPVEGEYAGRIGLANGTTNAPSGEGSWQWDPTTDSIHGAWSTGFYGAGFNVIRQGDRLVGFLYTFSDVIYSGKVTPEAVVTFMPVPCRSTSPGPSFR